MAEPRDLTLEQYAEKLREEVDAFVEKWRTNSALDPEHWPIKMTLADWDEQFIATTM